MEKKLIMWFMTLIALCLPGISYAVSCYKDKTGGDVAVTNTLPPNIYVSSAMENGTVLWRSDLITYNVACLGRTSELASESIYFWLNPKSAPPISGVSIGIMYNGVTTAAGTALGANVDTGFATNNYVANFTLTYSVVLIKTGAVQSSGVVNINNYSVFQLDGMGGINNGVGANLNQFINGTVNYSGGGTCSLASGDVNKQIDLQQIRPSDLPSVGNVAGKKPFTLSVTNCSAGTNTAQFTFQGSADTGNPSAFANRGTAKGVALMLGSSDDDSTIRADGTNNLKIARIQSGSGVLNLFAQYIATGAIQAGTVNTAVTVNITYQ